MDDPDEIATRNELLRVEVDTGDTLSHIAARFGMTWEDIYEHDANRALRALRPDPNVIHPGDIVLVPIGRKRRAVVSIIATAPVTDVRAAVMEITAPVIEMTPDCWHLDAESALPCFVEWSENGEVYFGRFEPDVRDSEIIWGHGHRESKTDIFAQCCMVGRVFYVVDHDYVGGGETRRGAGRRLTFRTDSITIVR